VRVVLASASPARLATLRSAGVDPVVIVSHVDESQFDDPDPRQLTVSLARAKATAVAALPSAADADLIIGCDSMLHFNGTTYGKPCDADAAAERWRQMRGGQGTLVTGHHLIAPGLGLTASAAAETTVHFAAVSDAEIDAYVATAEPLEVAGAFTIDGLGGAFVERIEGDHHNVVGISLPLVRDLIAQFGWIWPDLWVSVT
jgi:septum formation protein